MIDTLKRIFSDEALKNNKFLAILTVITILLGFGVISMAGKVITDYRHAQSIQAQMTDMRNELKDWEMKSGFINQQQYRPVPADKVDAVQSDLMLAMQSFHLNLTDYKIVVDGSKDKKAPTFKAFEVGFAGSYADTVNFLMNFHARDALLSIMQLDMSTQKGLINTKLVYRIYIK